MRSILTILLPIAAVPLFGIATLAAQDEATTKVDFAAEIQPILQSQCVKCHGAKKQEGDLRLDLRQHVFHADEDLWSILPGNRDFSTVYERITLDADDPDVMPAEGEKLTEEQVALIGRWIEEGAEWPVEADRKILELEAKRKEREVIELPALNDAEQKVQAAALLRVRETGALVGAVAANTIATEADFSLLGGAVKDEHVASLDGLQGSLVWLDLGRTAISDRALAQLTGFRHLRRLDLSNTRVTDAGLEQLAKLTRLEYLNLYGTQVTDAGLQWLKGLNRLQKLYVWQTQVTAAGADSLGEALPELAIDRGLDAAAMLAGDQPAPINETCPVSGKPIDSAHTSKLDDQVIGFCCGDCKAKFDADPEAFRAKLGLQRAPAPINDTCPVSDKPVDPAHTSTLDGKLVAFCCANCKAKFDADPEAFRAKLGLQQAPAPINDTCPVSDKPVDPAHTSTLDGKLVAFCCANCKAKFDADPAAFRAKLGLQQAPAPINDTCPVSDKPVDPAHTSTLDGKLVAFCCANCKAKFDADPAAFRAKLGLQQAPAPINDTCPVSDKPVDPAHTSTLDGKLVAFCCANCKAKFDADPAAFRAKLGLQQAPAPINDTCPVSDKPVDPAHTSTLDGKLVAFCCANCKAKFDADPAAFRAKLGGL